MIRRIVALAALQCLPSQSGAASTGMPDIPNIRIVVQYNFMTGANHWVSSGVFVDRGVRGTGPLVFEGPVKNVTDELNGQYGSFRWTYSKAKPVNGTLYGEHITTGRWTVIGGTGMYEGITGGGIVKSTWNSVTGSTHDRFEGTVNCPNC